MYTAIIGYHRAAVTCCDAIMSKRPDGMRATADQLTADSAAYDAALQRVLSCLSGTELTPRRLEERRHITRLIELVGYKVDLMPSRLQERCVGSPPEWEPVMLLPLIEAGAYYLRKIYNAW